MSAHTNYYKLGLFVLLAIAAGMGLVIMLGALRLGRDSVRYHSYFDESVHGLELGAPVKFRGVNVGTVEAVEIAPDHRHVDVISELTREDAERVGLRPFGTPPTVPVGLRAQVATQGLTGLKFLSLDLLDPARYPPPELPFAPDEHTIPTAPSLLKSLEDVVAKSMDRVPETLDALLAVTNRVDRILETLERKDVSGELVATLRHADQVLRSMRTTVDRLDRANLGEKAALAIDEIHGAATKMNGVLGDLGRSGHRTQRELDAALGDLRNAADAFRSLAFAIERDPEMLLKGKSKGKGFE
jgi:paraquat-inducible protein B